MKDTGTVGGRFRPVMDALERARRLGFWVEVVTLVVWNAG
jgi:hypothetical protein